MTRRLCIDDLTSVAVPEQPALAPDGSQIVYVLAAADPGGDRVVRCLWRVGTSAGEPAQLTRGQADTGPAWSPDGTRIAFLRGQAGAGQTGQAQLYLLPADGGEPEQLTTLPLGAGALGLEPGRDQDRVRRGHGPARFRRGGRRRPCPPRGGADRR